MSNSLSTATHRMHARRAAIVLTAATISIGALLGTAASAGAAATPTPTPKSCYVPGMPSGSGVDDGSDSATATPIPDDCADVTPVPATVPTPTPTPTSAIDSDAFTANSCKVTVTVVAKVSSASGATVQISGSGMEAGESVTFYVNSKVALASVSADGDGNVAPVAATLDKSYTGTQTITTSGGSCPAATVSLGSTPAATSGVDALAFTGVASGVTVAIAIALLLGGLLLVVLARARRQQH